MGIIAILMGLITVSGTLGYIETESTITNVNTIAIIAQFAGGFLLMYLGIEILQENTNQG